jgi:predicted thioredoxin/glutaredoxin
VELVVLVTRKGCHLCDDALRHLQDLGYEPVLKDVDADDELYRLYDFRVPVVLLDGKVLAEGLVTKPGLEAALGGAGRGSGPA